MLISCHALKRNKYRLHLYMQATFSKEKGGKGGGNILTGEIRGEGKHTSRRNRGFRGIRNPPSKTWEKKKNIFFGQEWGK